MNCNRAGGCQRKPYNPCPAADCGWDPAIKPGSVEQSLQEDREFAEEETRLQGLYAASALDVPNLRVLFDQWQRQQGVTLPIDSAERKLIPIQTGHNDYFPAAIAAVAAWSAFNNAKHNPGLPLHWSQAKSADHPDCIARHTVDMREAQDKFVRFVEATARAWRAYAELQMLAQELGAPKAPGAK
jgi:hypothetical protein